MCKKWNLFFIILIFVFGCKNQLDDFYKTKGIPDIQKNLKKEHVDTHDDEVPSNAVLYIIKGKLNLYDKGAKKYLVNGMPIDGKILFSKNNNELITSITYLKLGDKEVEPNEDIKVLKDGKEVMEKIISHISTTKIETTKLEVKFSANFEKEVIVIFQKHNQPTEMTANVEFKGDFKQLTGNITFKFLLNDEKQDNFDLSAIIDSGEYKDGDVSIFN